MSEEPTVFVRTCTRCTAPAAWIPVLLLYPSVLHGPSKPLTIQVWEPVCSAHQDVLSIKELATEGIYAMAEKSCANLRLPWPERSLTRLKFLAYDKSSLAQQKDREHAQEN